VALCRTYVYNGIVQHIMCRRTISSPDLLQNLLVIMKNDHNKLVRYWKI